LRRYTLPGGIDYRDNLFFRESVLGLFGTQVELQQDIDGFTIVAPPLVDGFQQMEGIHRLDQGDVRKDEFEFVRLEMTDEVPFDVGGHLGHFLRQFLRPVLAEEPLSRVVCFHQARDRVEFGNCHQFHS
jgi:hypothetical protein